MKCNTVRPDVECVFMSKRGCTFTQGECQPVIDKCETCNHIIEQEAGRFCDVFPDPVFKWSVGYCNFATHVKIEVKAERKVNPLKASKAGARGG